MRTSLRYFFLLCAPLVLLSACNPVDVEGDWSGMWDTSESAADGSITLEITQKNRDLDGTFSLGGTWCVGSGDLDGTVTGDEIDITLSNGIGGRVKLHVTVDEAEEQMSGSFEVTSGFCDNVTGTVDLERK